MFFIYTAPPLNGGLERGTYFRDQTVLLDNQGSNRGDTHVFNNNIGDLASRRQINKISKINLANDDDLNLHYDAQLLSARNQQRLRKLRDLEGRRADLKILDVLVENMF